MIVFWCVYVAVNRFRGKIGLECVKEGDADHDNDDDDSNVDDQSQTGVYDNVDNVQQQLELTRRRRRSRRDQRLDHFSAADAVLDDGVGTCGTTAADGDGGAAAAGAGRTETETGALNSILSNDDGDDGWSMNVRRRGRCANRLASNRVVGPSFVSSARVQLGGSGGSRLQRKTAQQLSQQQHQLQQQQHSGQFLQSSGADTADVSPAATSMPKVNNETSSATVGDECIKTVNQSPASESELTWNGYDNIMELKEAIFSTPAAKMAAGSKAKRGVATTVPASAEGQSSTVVPLSSGRAIGERVVDVRRQRLSATGREMAVAALHDPHSAAATSTTAGQSSVTVILSDTSPPATLASRAASAGAVQTQDQKADASSSTANSDTSAPVDVAYTDNTRTNGGSLQKKKAVSFEKEDDAKSSETKSAAGKGRKHKNKDKPPIGKAENDSSKKAEKKSELRKEKKECTSTAGSDVVSERSEQVDGKTEQPVSKISFLKSLLTRSRSPSPKRGTNSTSNRPASPVSVGRDVAKRLSDPLKSSFKQTSDSVPVLKASVKQREKNKKQSSADEKKNSEQSSEPKDNSNCKENSMVNSSRKCEETSTLPSIEEAKTPLTPTPEECGEISSPPLKTENLTAAANSTGSRAKQGEVTDTPSSVPYQQSTESAVIVTTSYRLPTSEVEGKALGAAGVNEQSSERRRSATIITLRRGSDSTTNRSSHQTASAAVTLPSTDRNPWLVNLKEFRLRPNLDSFEGEKVFKKGTATTRMMLPGLSRPSVDDFPHDESGDSEPQRSQTLQRLPTATARKPPLQRRDRHSATTTPPIYDTVYHEDSSSICKSTAELTTGNGSQSSVVAQRTDDVVKSHSLQDLEVRAGTRQVSSGPGDTAAATAGRTRTPTMTEHAIDDDELRNSSGHIIHGRGDCGSVPTTLSKPTKNVTFSDDVGADSGCPSAERRLESVQGLCKMETSIDGKAGSDLSTAVPTSRTHSPAAGEINSDRCVKTKKSASLPPLCRQPTIHSNSIDLRADVSAVRDTITSCDLEELPQYMSDMYRQQKLERQREQELAARDRQRLENIDKMWKEFESKLPISKDVASSVTNSFKAAETAEDSVADVRHFNTPTVQNKPRQQVILQPIVEAL